MLSRQFCSNFKTLNKARTLRFARAFSTEAGSATEAASVPEPTKEEIEAGRSEWGLKYDDECLKFEKEWTMMAEQVEKEQNVFLESELGDLQ